VRAAHPCAASTGSEKSNRETGDALLYAEMNIKWPSTGYWRVDQTPVNKTEVENESRVGKTDTDRRTKS
jgi:hypothetical protein